MSILLFFFFSCSSSIVIKCQSMLSMLSHLKADRNVQLFGTQFISNK